MRIKAALKHLDADGCEGCFNLYDEYNNLIGGMSVSDAYDLAWNIQMQIQSAQEERRVRNANSTRNAFNAVP